MPGQPISGHGYMAKSKISSQCIGPRSLSSTAFEDFVFKTSFFLEAKELLFQRTHVELILRVVNTTMVYMQKHVN